MNNLQYIAAQTLLSFPASVPRHYTLKEVDRLDYQHYVLRLLFNGNIVAPVEEGTVHRIPAVGCGTGRWCREGAEPFPSAMVIGTDIEEHVSPGLHTFSLCKTTLLWLAFC